MILLFLSNIPLEQILVILRKAVCDVRYIALTWVKVVLCSEIWIVSKDLFSEKKHLLHNPVHSVLEFYKDLGQVPFTISKTELNMDIRNVMPELHHELPSKLRLGILGNKEMLGNSQKLHGDIVQRTFAPTEINPRYWHPKNMQILIWKSFRLHKLWFILNFFLIFCTFHHGRWKQKRYIWFCFLIFLLQLSAKFLLWTTSSYFR